MSPGRGHLNNSERSLEGEEVRGEGWHRVKSGEERVGKRGRTNSSIARRPQEGTLGQNASPVD